SLFPVPAVQTFSPRPASNPHVHPPPSRVCRRRCGNAHGWYRLPDPHVFAGRRRTLPSSAVSARGSSRRPPQPRVESTVPRRTAPLVFPTTLAAPRAHERRDGDGNLFTRQAHAESGRSGAVAAGRDCIAGIFLAAWRADGAGADLSGRGGFGAGPKSR